MPVGLDETGRPGCGECAFAVFQDGQAKDAIELVEFGGDCQVDHEPVEIIVRTGLTGSSRIPCRHLKTNHDAQDHDHELDRDSEPVLLADGTGDAGENHSESPRMARISSSIAVVVSIWDW